ncbi:MAG: hypothetical protein ACOCWJ_01910 [Verrucomicrobiota bacterium]
MSTQQREGAGNTGEAPAPENPRRATSNANSIPEPADSMPRIPDKLVEKTEMERMYEALCDIHLQRLRKPRIGHAYNFRFSNGQTEEGRLESAGKGAISARLKHGVIQIPIQAMAARERVRFFPEQAARILALRDLGRTTRQLEQVRVREEIRRGRKIASTGATEERDDSPGGEDGHENRESGSASQANPFLPDGEFSAESAIKFAPAPAASPDEIKPLLMTFVQWLNVQQHRVGGKIAKSVHAKRHASKSVVLYLQTAPAFRAQNYETRFRLADSIWQFWSFRCHDAGLVPHPRRAFLVLVDSEQRIVGGSRAHQSNDVWVAKDSE